MNFYAGTLGQLIIVEAFVLYIWLQVMLDAVKNKDGSVTHKKFMLTSIGLVLNAFAIVGIMLFRIYYLATDFWPFVWALVGFYIMLAIGGFLLIVAAYIGTSGRLLKVFFAVTVAWTAYVFIVVYRKGTGI